MSRTCNLSYRINNGSVIDIATHGFHLVKSDDRVVPPIREYEKQEYPEYAAAEIYPYAAEVPFEYTVKLLVFGSDASVNASVREFWDSLFETSGRTVARKAYPVTLFNYWKGVQVTGYPKSPNPDSTYPVPIEYENSAYLFDFILDVVDPTTLIPL